MWHEDGFFSKGIWNIWEKFKLFSYMVLFTQTLNFKNITQKDRKICL